MALFLHRRTTIKSNAFTAMLRRLLSTSNSGDGGDQPPTTSSSPFSSLFKDVKDTLKHKQPHSTPSSPPRNPSSFSHTPPPTEPSLEEIRSNLSEFRRRTSAPPPGDPSKTAEDISFQEMYRRRSQNPEESMENANMGTGNAGIKSSIDKIRESLRNLPAANGGRGNRRVADRMSLPTFKDALKLRPSDSAPSTVIGGTSALPESVFGREMKEKMERDESMEAMNTEFVRTYDYNELGEKLRKLRPEGKRKEWFSLEELNERLMRVREMDKNSLGRIQMVMRESLAQLQAAEDEKANKASRESLYWLSQIGGTPTYLLGPPKEHLVEKYFHPDNMSSAEKLKIELAKVRDEFKMSESDCGSARVQVAQLTTKIKHLSAVLHKKDVHSRKGLLAMVQRRKRLLKYLRRTDWDSYCFVISKLGLRDNPEHSYRSRSSQAATS